MSLKGPDPLKSPLVGGGQADLTGTVSNALAERAQALAQLRPVSDEAARQFADTILPAIRADQTDGLFGAAFLVPPFGWIDRMHGRSKRGALPGKSTANQLTTGFKQLYAQASHQLHRALERLQDRSAGVDGVLIKEQELVPIQKALVRIDEVLQLKDRLTMLGQRSEINQALRELEGLAKDVRASLAPLVQAVEVRDRLALGDKMKHLGQEDDHPPVDLAALRRANTAPAAFERYQPGDVLIIGLDEHKRPIFGAMLDAVETKDGPVARVLTLVGDQIEMRFVPKARVEELNAFKLNDNYEVDGARFWVAPDREKGVRLVRFDPAQPGRAPVEIAPGELAQKLGAPLAVPDATQATAPTPTVIQAVHGHETPKIMLTSNEVFDGAAWSTGHQGRNDDALRVGKVGGAFAALIADQVGASERPAEVSTAIIDGIWGQMEHNQVGGPGELMERGARAGARALSAGLDATTSLTAAMFEPTKEGTQLEVGHAGNTQLMVIRRGSVLFKSEPHVTNTGVTASVQDANNPRRTIGRSSAPEPLFEHHTVELQPGDVVLMFTNGVRNMNLLEQSHHADEMAQPHTEFTPFQLAEEIRGKATPSEMVAAIRDLATARARSGSGKPADLSIVALTIKGSD